MITSSYCALIPLAIENNFTIAKLAELLSKRLPEYESESTTDRIVISQNEWTLNVVLDKGDWVNIEAKEMAKFYPDLPNIESLKSSTQRIDISSYANDSEMEHFNTYLFVLEEIETFQGVLFEFDPRDAKTL
ncbi:hypothetical protein [Myxosarcina sp. GI1]|uniref:hypothetical protein n=1 Tax=Myxosarcina sp. GI1 TaxID=1541065 RepID=UPI00055C92D4|nr:hypothetical protein [Myxosarcina sp. GI1]